MVDGQKLEGKWDIENGVNRYGNKKRGLSYQVSRKIAFKVQVGLLDGLHMGENDHACQPGYEPSERDGQLFSRMEEQTDPFGKEKDQQDKYKVDNCVYNERGGGYGGPVLRLFALADKAYVRVFQQIGFCRFKYRSDGEEKRPGTHLRLGQGADKYDKIYESKKGKGKSLKEGVKSGPYPIGREIFFYE